MAFHAYAWAAVKSALLWISLIFKNIGLSWSQTTDSSMTFCLLLFILKLKLVMKVMVKKMLVLPYYVVN